MSTPDRVQDLLAKLHGARERVVPARTYTYGEGHKLSGLELLKLLDAGILVLKAFGDQAQSWDRLQQLIDTLDELT